MTDLLGLYLHIPFCQSKCDYCNFASGVFPDSLIRPYFEALREEVLGTRGHLERTMGCQKALRALPVDTIYLGGGTPSLVDGAYIIALMRLLHEVFWIVPDAEVTLEVNPGTVNSKKVEQHLTAGINRISIGIQSFQDSMLQRIGRSHCVADSLTTLALYRSAGMQNVSLDLIAGLPGQTLEDWRSNLDMIERLSPEHVSLYMLEIHEGTRFGTLYGGTEGNAHFNGIQRSQALNPSRSLLEESPEVPVPLPGDEEVVQFYTEAVDRFASRGYRQYEISNFAKPGRQSRHNVKYWTDQPFIGFGCGAYSYFNGTRWGNERSVSRYIDLIRHQPEAVSYRCDLTPEDRQEEAIFLGLRLTEGIQFSQYHAKFGTDLRDSYRAPIEYLSEAGLVECTADRLRLTPQGWLLSNEVFTEFLR